MIKKILDKTEKIYIIAARIAFKNILFTKIEK
jgi:hypothetical protein